MDSSLYFFLQYLVMSLDGLTTGIMFELLLPPRNASSFGRYARPFCFWVLVLLICLPSYLMHYKVLPVMNLLFTAAGTVTLIIVLYQTGMKDAFFLFALYFVLMFIGEASAQFLFSSLYEAGLDWTKDRAIMPLLTISVLVFFYKLAAAFWLRRPDRFRIIRSPWLYGPAAGILLYSFFSSAAFAITGNGQWTLRDRFSTLVYLLAGFAALSACLLFQSLKKRDLLKSLETYYAEQQAYYRTLEQKEQETARIRHDLVNILGTVQTLAAQDHPEDAVKILREFTSRIRARRTE